MVGMYRGWKESRAGDSALQSELVELRTENARLKNAQSSGVEGNEQPSKSPKNKPKPLFDPNDQNHATIAEAIRKNLRKPTGELTKADLGKVTRLVLSNSQLTDVSSLAELTKLEELDLDNNQLTDMSGLVGLTQLDALWLDSNKLTADQLEHLAGLKELTLLTLRDNPNLTLAEIAKLQKALPKCKISHNAKK